MSFVQVTLLLQTFYNWTEIWSAFLPLQPPHPHNQQKKNPKTHTPTHTQVPPLVPDPQHWHLQNKKRKKLEGA